MDKDVFSYIIEEESAYQTLPVPVIDGYEWSMFDHVKKSTLYKNSQLTSGKDDNKPIKNIIRPIINVAYRLEGFDVKDIQPFVDDEKNYYKSFLTRKYHAKWARKYGIDTFLDDLVESYVDYGLALVKNVNDKKPEVVPLQRLAFVDQTDVLGGAICEKHMYQPDELMGMSGKWNTEKIKDAIVLAQNEKTNSQAFNLKQKTPGKYIEVYELHGTFPETWIDPEGDPDNYIKQDHYITFGNLGNRDLKKGITLFSGRRKKDIYKAIVRDKIYGRACGFGGIEELFEAQVWTTYSMIKIKDMLDAAALMILQTADTAFKTRNNTEDLKTGDILTHEEGKPVSQISLSPQNMQAFNNAVIEWENHARTTGSANEAVLGESPSTGTPFALQALVTQEGKGMHEFRQGKIATFVSEIYRDWVLKYLVDEMNQGQKFVDELSLDELEFVANAIAECQAEELVKGQLIRGIVTTPEQLDALKEESKQKFMKGGSKRFFEILQNELKSLPVDVEVNIKGKQKDLSRISEKLTNIIRQVIATPQVLQDPNAARIFNKLLESSGLDQMMFQKVAAPPQPVQGAPQPSDIVSQDQLKVAA